MGVIMATSVLDERKRQLIPRDTSVGAPTKVPDRYPATSRYSGVVDPKKPTTISPTYINPEGE